MFGVAVVEMAWRLVVTDAQLAVDELKRVNRLYDNSQSQFLTLASSPQHWSNISIGHSVEWPKERSHHAATHLSGLLFVIVGGAGHQVSTNDMWLCDTTTKLWKKVLFLVYFACAHVHYHFV